MEDGSPPHIAKPVIHLLKRHFRNDKIMSYQFLSRTVKITGFISCDFWLQGYLKNVMFSGLITNLAEFKVWIMQYILNVTPETLQSVEENVVYQFQLVEKKW